MRAQVLTPSFLSGNAPLAVELSGYEIHMGTTQHALDAPAPFQISSRNQQPLLAADGAISPNGTVVGTMLHGLLENTPLRERFLSHLRQRKGLTASPTPSQVPSKNDEYARLATAVRDNIDMALLWRLLGLVQR